MHTRITTLIFTLLALNEVSAQPQELPLVGSLETDFITLSVFNSGDHIYCGEGTGGLRVIDATDPQRPAEVATLDTPGLAAGITGNGEYIYLADWGDEGGLRIIDVSDPTEPEEIGFIDVPGNADDLFVQDRYAYVGAELAGLQVVDISDPEHPELVGSLDTPGYADGIIVRNNLAYVADRQTGILIVDVSTPNHPQRIGACDLPEARANDLRVIGHLAYVTGLEGGLYIVDVSDPEDPQLVGRGECEYAEDVDVIGDYAFVADGQEGMIVLDVSDPEHPRRVAYNHDFRTTRGITVWGDFAYVASDTNGLGIINVIDYVPSIVLSAEEIEFDTVAVGSEVEYDLTIRNVGGVQLNITSIRIAGDGFWSEFEEDITVDPYDEIQYQITFAPPDRGVFNGVMTIISDDQDDGEIAVTLSGRGIYSYPIPLRRNWNLISSPLTPNQRDVQNIWAEVVNRRHLFITKDQDGRFYYPNFPFNNMVDWDVRQGYWAKLTEADTLNIIGFPVEEDTPIPLRRGWSIVAYFPETEVDALEAFQGIEDALVLAKDVNGRFYHRPTGFSNLGRLQRGQGYQVMVSEAVELIWNVPDRWLAAYQADIERAPVYFYVPRTTGPNNMSFLLESAANGSETGVFTSDGLCVGAAVLAKDGLTGMAVWGDDPTTEEQDGAVENEQLFIRIWNGEAESSPTMIWKEGDGRYATGSFGWIILKESVILDDFTLDTPFPNPFNSQVALQYHIPNGGHITLTIYDLRGRLVATLVEQNLICGDHQAVWDASLMPSGVYWARLTTKQESRTAKLLLVR